MFNWLQVSTMMLKEVEIENFKSIGPKIRIEFKPLTIFVGPNRSGKSSILQAIYLATSGRGFQELKIGESIVNVKYHSKQKDISEISFKLILNPKIFIDFINNGKIRSYIDSTRSIMKFIEFLKKSNELSRFDYIEITANYSYRFN